MDAGRDAVPDDIAALKEALATERAKAPDIAAELAVARRGQEMILRCRDYRQAIRWARLERKTYKIPDPDTSLPADHGLPLFLRSGKN